MTTPRNERASRLLHELFESAGREKPKIDSQVSVLLDEIFATTSWGFREIVLVVVVARLLDPSFRASDGLYDCNPRSLYEGPIVAELVGRSIPHRKSGPLNVAKAAKGLSAEWAAQRRPARVAAAVVGIVAYIEEIPATKLRSLGLDIARRFLAEATRITALTVEAKAESDPDFLYSLCRTLIDDAPDAGNTPQRVVGLLLKTYHDDLQTGLAVIGYEDRASTTSTTSKKPGDVAEVQLDGTPVSVIEVTVKPFGAQRVRESNEALAVLRDESSVSVNEVRVICRAEDAHPDAESSAATAVYLGRFDSDGISYLFLDIYEWIMQRLLALTADGRLAFFGELTRYVDHFNTSENVKIVWAKALQRS